MNAILLVGGMGTRLRPLTLTQPKALLPVLNRPFIQYQLDILHQAGIKNVIMACGRSMSRWVPQLKKCGRKSLKVDASIEPSPLGTGGAIRFAYEHLKRKYPVKGQPVIVFNGDVFFDFDMTKMIRFHARHQGEGTILIRKVDNPSRFGVVSMGRLKRIKKFIEKPKDKRFGSNINAGAYILSSSWIEKIPMGRELSIEKDIFPKALGQGASLYGYEMNGYWNDIGTPESYLQAHRDLIERPNRWTGRPLFRKRGALLRGQNVHVGKNVRITGHVTLGPGVKVESEATLEDCVILEHTHVKRGVSITNSLIGRSCTINEYSKIGEGTVLGDKTTLPPYTRC